MSQFDCDKLMSSLHTEVDYSSFKDVDIVIEAVFEDINLKHRIIKEVCNPLFQVCMVFQMGPGRQGCPMFLISRLFCKPVAVVTYVLY